MKTFSFLSVTALALGLVVGCQETTTTGPATKTTSSGKPLVKKLTVMEAKSQTIKQGDTDKVTIMINRDNFDDPVTISLNDLPAGVTVIGHEMTIPAGSSSLTVELKANPDAAVGDHMVQVAAKAPGLDENVQSFKLTVKEKG